MKVSVIVPAYNAADYLRQSVESILGQTFADFELIVVDDCSTDSTPDILASYGDPRLRVVRNPQNMGVVGARNRAMEEVRGEYVASFDADDVSLPTRLAKQVAYLDANPGVALMGTASRYLEDGKLQPGRRVAGSTPLLVRWLLHISNPLVHPSLMYRADTIRRLGVLLREECKYAEDFDLHHRIMQVADVAFLDDPLILYRRHPGSITFKHEPEMIAKAIGILAVPYQRWFGPDADAAAALVVTHVMAGKPAVDEPTVRRLGEVLSRMTDGFFETYGVGSADRAMIQRNASEIWWQAVRSATRSGRIGALAAPPPPFARSGRAGFMRTEAVPAVASGLFPFKRTLRQVLNGAGSAAHPAAIPEGATTLFGVSYEPVPVEADRPPTLFVVVDAEAGSGQAEAVAEVERAQTMFDRYGLRPIYAVSYAVASEPAGYERLRAIHDRGGCEIGALLHPSTNPPFEEGDASPDLEERKLVALLDAIRANFQVTPRFFRAGRHGLGPNTMRIIAEHGIAVDLSIMPGRDLSPDGGPDFRRFATARRSLLDGRLISMPMTRGPSGLLASRFGGFARGVELSALQATRISGALARLGLLETVTLSPEGEPAAKQVALIRAMLARQQRSFVLHYHAASLAPGFTPYAWTQEEADRIVQRLDTVCRFFFEEVGGVPGYPQDLLPPALRTAPANGTPPARQLSSSIP